MNIRRIALASAVVMLIFGSIVTTASAQTRSKHKKHSKLKVFEKTIQADRDMRDRKTAGGDTDRGFGGKRRPARYADENDRSPQDNGKPTESKLVKAGRSFVGDLRTLPYVKPVKKERIEREGPMPSPVLAGAPILEGDRSNDKLNKDYEELPAVSSPSATAPPPIMNFAGLDFATWGAGHPPDTVGDVGPEYFIQAINTSIGVYRKSDGVRVAAFTFDTFMSLGNFGNLCDSNNFGDPVILYDSFEDRWIITDFAFTVDGSGNVINPPGNFQCFAASKSGDPIAGGWNYYSINTTGGLGDYPKFGVWPDGLYMTTSMFDYAASGSFQNPRVYALNKAQMYEGAPTVQVVSFDAPASDFTILPSNARIQTGTPPPGSPNYYLATWQYLNAVTIYKFHVDWDRISISTFTGPELQTAPSSWPNASVPNAPSLGGNALDVLQIRAMMQNQYSNIGGVESLWATHTVRRANTSGFSAPRWYQVNVTGGTVAASMAQGATWDPDGANVIYRFMPSLAVDRAGDLALGYSTSSSTTKPAIKYAGRLDGDAANTFSQTEQTLIQGTGTQTGSCGGTCTRWGDYSAMTLDPDGCTFWYTNMYYAVDGLNHQTRIGSFAYPSCIPLSNGSIEGTVSSTVTGLPINGATVTLGSRTTTTNASGYYSFSALPPGTYPVDKADATGYVSDTATNLILSSGSTVAQNFSLATADSGACLTDTTQTDFQTGVTTNTDLSVSAGDAVLTNPTAVEQQNTTVTSSGFAMTSTSWTGQTFTPSVSGKIAQVDLDLFCSGCTGTTPNLTVSVRATSGATPVPTGADLASATLAGFNSGAGGYYSVTFSSPLSVTAGTRYAIVVRATSNPSTGTYAYVCSCAGTGTVNSNPYANGQRVTSANSGSTWTADTTVGGRDLGFKVYMNNGYSATGDLVSAVKDSNPVSAGTTTWGTISWNATVPANTSLLFQAAASNSPFGPFNFVGPNGTSATYFTNGASLSQFDGNRYLKYKAIFATTNNTVTPTLGDVTICYTTPRVWTGAVSSDWNNPGNWSSGGLPGSGDAAIIPTSGVTNNPTNTSSVSVASLSLGSGRIVDTGGNTITVNTCSPSAITGGSSTSYVKGSLIRCVDPSGTYLFPVGTALGYSPASLSGIVGTGNFSVTPVEAYIPGVQTTTSPKRYWSLTPIGGVTSANISLTYLDADLPPSPPEASYVIIRNSGGSNGMYTPTTVNTATNTFTLNGVSAFSDWTVGILAPTAAGVTVSGRVLTSNGQGLRNAVVMISDQAGHTRSAITSAFGYYSFTDVEVGQTYTVSVSSKRFTFATRLVNLTDAIDGLDFTAQ